AGPRGGTDERERIERHPDRAGAGALADDDVDLVVLHRRIERLFDDGIHAVNLVDEEDVARLEAAQDRRQVALRLEHRARRRANRHAQFVGDDVGERRLAEPRRTVEQYVIECLTTLTRGGNRDDQVLAQPFLADVVAKGSRPQPGFELPVVVIASGGHDARVGHARESSRSTARSAASNSAVASSWSTLSTFFSTALR